MDTTIVSAAPAYLERLNEAQRSAVLHGEGAPAGPLLVIAGAGWARPRRWRTGSRT